MTIALTPGRRIEHLDVGQYSVQTAGSSATVRPNFLIKMLSATHSDGETPEAAECSADTDVPIGISQGVPGSDATTYGVKFDATHLFSGVEWVLVGTGGATRGLRASLAAAADGLTNAPALGNGTTRFHSPGIFLETGSAGDIVALGVCPSVMTKT